MISGLKIIRYRKFFFITLLTLFFSSSLSAYIKNEKPSSFSKKKSKNIYTLKINRIKKYLLLHDEPEVSFEDHLSRVKLTEFSQHIADRGYNIRHKLSQAKIYKRRSHTFFWLGFGALVTSLFFNRSSLSGAANALLGISWTVWLGNSALEQAQYDDIKDLYNQHISEKKGPY